MANPTVTPADVLPSASGTPVRVTWGATVTQGAIVYKDPATNTWKLAQCDGTAIEAGSSGIGIALTGGSSGQTGLITTRDAAIDPGFTATKAVIYVVSATAGAPGLHSDLVSTNRLTILGIGTTATLLNFDPIVTGEALT